MKRGLIYIIFLIIVINTYNLYAANIDILTPRDIYSQKETAQAEIIINVKPLNQISNLNLQLINESNSIIPVQYFLEKLSDQHYFIYFKLPNIEKGQYKFQINNVQYIEDEKLRIASESKELQIYSLNKGFDFIASKQNEDGSFSTITETALLSLALKNIYPEKSEKALNYLINNQDPQGCYPKGNCNIKDTSFALLTLKEFNKETAKIKNWLLDAQNNFNIGKWSLILDSGYSNCNVNNKNYEILNKTEINIENPSFTVNCTLKTKFTVTHSYLGNVKTLYTYEGKLANINIENSGCFGKFYRSTCDYESTGLAIYVLQKLNEQISIEWFEKNPSDTKTLDQALLNLIKNNEYSKNWLLSNIITEKKAWSSASSSISQNIDLYSSVFAALSLKNTGQYEKSLKFLETQTTRDVLTSSLILYFFFNNEKLQSVISVYPGFVNNKQLFQLIIKNENKIPVLININAPNFTNMPKEILLTDIKVFTIRNPQNAESYNIEIKYNNKSYTIPVLVKKILTEKTNVTNVTIREFKPIIQPPKDSIIILSKRTRINETLLADDPPIITQFDFTNKWSYPLNNITFILTGNLKDIIELERLSFTSIHQDEIKNQRLTINKNKNALGLYNGELIITSEEKTAASIPITLFFTQDRNLIKQKLSDTEKNNITKLISETKEQNKTKAPLGKKKTKKSYLIWLIPFIILLIIAIILFILARRPKKETFDKFIEGIKRE